MESNHCFAFLDKLKIEKLKYEKCSISQENKALEEQKIQNLIIWIENQVFKVGFRWLHPIFFTWSTYCVNEDCNRFYIAFELFLYKYPNIFVTTWWIDPDIDSSQYYLEQIELKVSE